MTPYFPATHSVLSVTALTDILLPEYGLTDIDEVVYYQAGLNDTYLIKCLDNNKYILRAYRKDWRSLSDINCEIDVLNFLHKHNIAVSTPIPRLDKKFISTVRAAEGIRHIVLFSYAEGKNLAYESDHEYEALIYGQTLGKLHNALDNFTSTHQRFKIDNQHLIDKPLESIKDFLHHRQDDWGYIKQLAEKIKQQFSAYPVNSLKYGFCHGDLNSANAHLHNKKLTLFDFDCCGEGYFAYDLAVFRWGVRLQKKEDKLWKPFIQAYKNERHLNNAELKSISLFIGMRHLWHLGLHTLLSADRGRHWIDDNYFDQQIQFLKDWEHEYMPLD